MKYLFICLLLTSLTCFGQQTIVLPELGNRVLTTTQQLPETLTAGRTVVMVKASNEALIDKSWMKACEQLQLYFAKLKIDAVAYVYIGDFLAGRDATPNFNSYIQSRDISNLVFFYYYPDAAKEDYQIAITTYNQQSTLIDLSQEAWYKKGNSLKEVMTALGNDIIRKELPQTNFLVPDIPEFIDDIKVLNKRRFPVYTTDIRIEKLAVPYFDSVFVDKNQLVSPTLLQEINNYNATVAAKNRELEELMMGYPYKYGFVKYAEDPRFFFSNGYQFILMHLSARASTLRNMLEYEKNARVTHFISVNNASSVPIAKKIPVEQPVYKFYIRHSISGNVYLGDEWDADTTWQAALRNFIDNSLVNAQ